MKQLKVLCIFGTRPETTKMAPVIFELRKRSEIKQVTCVTAQHRSMLDQMLNDYGITPDYDLDLMRDRQTLAGVTAGVLTGVNEVLLKEQPDLVLVHGDTVTTFAASLAAFYQGIKVGHVEAGLRSYNKDEPFPEEVNRLLTADLAWLHFAPVPLAKEQLLKENITKDDIFVTGNTAIDCVLYSLNKTQDGAHFFENDYLNHFDYTRRIITMTAHRRENLGEPLRNICKAALKIIENNDIDLIYAVHLNPLVRETAYSILGGHPRVHLIDPPNVTDLHNLMKRSYLVMTDSGGLQEEAPVLNKPVVVLRNVTERPEGVEAGCLVLAGTEEENIVNHINSLLNDKDKYDLMAGANCPFGDGLASVRIVDYILYRFGMSECPREFGG